MPTDRISSWTAVAVEPNVGDGDGVGVPELSPVPLGLTIATGVRVGNGIGGRLDEGGRPRSSWPAMMRPMPTTASSTGTIVPAERKRLTRRSLAA